MEPNDKELFKQLQDAAREYDEWKKKNMILGGQLSSSIIGPAYTPATGSPTPKPPGRPVGSKTKDKEVIIQETVDRLIEHIVRLLTKYNYGEEHLSDAEIIVDEKANYAFVTVAVNVPGGSVVTVSERVKVANKTDPNKNWQALNQAFYAASAKKVAQKIDEDMSNIFISIDPEIDSTSNDF